MSPKKLNASWRGPCSFRDYDPSTWNLMSKGLGKQHFSHLTRIMKILFECLFHYAVNMLSRLSKCQFINSGLLSIRQSNRKEVLYLLVLLLFIPCVCAKPTPGRPFHINKGIYCYITTCRAGEEAVPCKSNWTSDRCRPCPADRYMIQDNVPSDQKLTCYKEICMPDTQRLVQTGTVSASNPPKCVCDTTRDYFQHGRNPDDCRKKKCPSMRQLLLNGTCVCMEGRVVNSVGECVWEYTPLTTLSTLISSTNGSQNAVTIRPSTISDLTNDIFNTTTVPIYPENTTHEYTRPSTTSSTSVGHGREDITYILLVIIILIVTAVAISAGFVYKCITKKQRPRTTKVNPDDNTEQNVPINNVTINGDIENIQIGSHNVMYKTGNGYNQLPGNEAEE